MGGPPHAQGAWPLQVVALMSCRFMNADGNGSREQAIKCMEWCLTKDAHVLSNSWGEVPNSQSLQVRAERLLRALAEVHSLRASYLLRMHDCLCSPHASTMLSKVILVPLPSILSC